MSSSSRSSERPTDDPVRAAVRNAPRMAPEMASICRALVAEAKDDPRAPSAWLTEEQLMARVALRRLGRG